MNQLVNRNTGEVLALPGDVSETALVLPADLSFDEWVEYGRRISLVTKACMWWLGDWWAYGDHKYGERATQALDSEYAYSTWQSAAWVASRIPPEERHPALSFGHHKAVAGLEMLGRRNILDEAEREGWTREEIRQAVRRMKAEERIGKAAEQAPDLAAVGVFQVLYVDPPWRYDYAESTQRAIENQYPTMALDEIKALDVPAADDSVLLLWATSPKLLEALEVMEAWDFEYRTNMVWVKDQIGMGYYARQRHELLLIGKRGKLPVPGEGSRPDSVIEAPRQEHSKKPDCVYGLIDSMYPQFSKVELFARQSREGWSSWGNQV